MFYSAFQSNAFWNKAFQIGNNDNQPSGGGYVYHSPSSKAEQEKRAKIAQEKTELQKVDSVLEEYKRKRELALQAQQVAKRKAAVRLAALERGYLEEIDRLMQVRALLMHRIRQNEESLILLLMMRRRRLKVA